MRITYRHDWHEPRWYTDVFVDGSCIGHLTSTTEQVEAVEAMLTALDDIGARDLNRNFDDETTTHAEPMCLACDGVGRLMAPGKGLDEEEDCWLCGGSGNR